MATISSQLKLNDGMSGVLSKISRALTITLNSFEQIQRVSGNAINLTNIAEARSELIGANVAIEEMNRNIKTAGNSQERFNQTMRSGGGAADAMLSKVKSIAATVMTMAGVNKLIGLSDQMAGSTARLNLMVDDGGSVAELQQKIFNSAQASRGAYMDVMQTVSKLGILAGNAFKGNDEIIRFTELMNKNFKIGGASLSEQTNSMYQLTQAMASGKLQGDEFRSIRENAPLLAKSIESYMQASGVGGTMKEWAAEGMITSDVIKAAMFSSADEIDARFASIPMTWSDVWTNAGNRAIKALDPVLKQINKLANSEDVQTMLNAMCSAFGVVASVALAAFGIIASGVNFMVDNWSILEPIIWGVVAALAAYGAYLAITNGLELISNSQKGIAAVADGIKAAAIWATTSATWAATTAQLGLNSAMYACPIVWIIIAVIALVALFYAAVAAVNKFAGTTKSATGFICCAIMLAVAGIGNIVTALFKFIIHGGLVLWNFVAAFANFFANVFTDPIGAVARLIFDLVDTALSLLQSLASAIDTVFGSSLAAGVQGWRDSLGGWVDDTFGRGVEVMAKMNPTDMNLGRIEYGTAWDAGYKFGEGIDTKVSNMFTLPDNSIPGMDALMGNASAIADNTSSIAQSAGASADAQRTTQEDLKYMRDIAEQEAINRFTTAEVKIDMTGMTNKIDSSMDLDGVISRLTDGFADALSVAAEGVHA